VAEPKREEEKIFSYDTGEPPSSEPSFLGDDPPPGGSAPGEESALAVQVARLRAEKEDLLQTLVRRQADFENYRKRALQAHDDPAYEEYRKGMMLIRKQLWDALARHGVERIDAAGKIFDPHFHQAIERAESKDHPDGFILHVFQDGYIFHGRVLRPAIVRVVVHTDGDTNSRTFEN